MEIHSPTSRVFLSSKSKAYTSYSSRTSWVSIQHLYLSFVYATCSLMKCFNYCGAKTKYAGIRRLIPWFLMPSFLRRQGISSDGIEWAEQAILLLCKKGFIYLQHISWEMTDKAIEPFFLFFFRFFLNKNYDAHSLLCSNSNYAKS